MKRLGRVLAAALLALVVAMPGVAAASTDASENPLSELPSEYEPALDMAAEELGVSPDDLQDASKKELLELLCAELKNTSTDDIVARVRKALRSASSDELGGLSEDDLAQLEAQLPMLVTQLKTACSDTATGVDETSDDADDADDSDDDDTATPTPTNIETGAGGVTGTEGGTVPTVFGAVFALLFGAFGVAIIRMRQSA